MLTHLYKIISLLFIPYILFGQKPQLLLLKTYTDENITGWYMSEKLDGIRAYWDGKTLWSRGGNRIYAPKYFIKNLPTFELDGELWSKRGEFEYISSTVRDKAPSTQWKNITYNIFEVPNQEGNLSERLLHVKHYEGKYLTIIPQIKIENALHVKAFAKAMQDKGAEGIVVRDGSVGYIAKRSSKALKLKPYMDAECEVKSYTKGKGKYQGEMGALVCELQKSKKIIKIGSGFSDEVRKNPPSIGSIITFKYYGFTKNNIPKFPVYLRVRVDVIKKR